MSVQVGDRLVRQTLSTYRTSESEVVVTKVGRKWGFAAPVGGGVSYKFDLETGYEDGGEYTANWRIVNAERIADDKRRAALKDALKEAGIEVEYGIRSAHITTDQLKQIADVLGVAGDV